MDMNYAYGIEWVIMIKGHKSIYVKGEVYSSIVEFVNAIREDYELGWDDVKFRVVKNLPR